MNFLLILMNISNENEFGFNDNILETNIINLAAVVGIVVFFVGNNVILILENRRQTIINNLREADQRAAEAQDKLNQAKQQLQIAEKKAKEIREEGLLKATQEKNNCLSQYEQDLARLTEGKEENITFFKAKAFQTIYIALVSKALQKVKTVLKKPTDDQYHLNINNFFIARFSDYNTKNV
jgi:F-type H+-transporting ATPase subunit b